MHKYINNLKAIQIANFYYEKSLQNGLLNIVVDQLPNGQLRSKSGHQFINMSSYSYLGLDRHPEIVKMAAQMVLKIGILNSSISRVRIYLGALEEAENSLSALFSASAITVSSCSAAAEGLLAAGVFTNNVPPVMIFDKNAHFCMNIMKAVCGDETTVTTCPHNDLNFIEDACKKNQSVAYVTDGVYSTGGCAPVKELLNLQDKYGLFLLFDEAHSISACGDHGKGYVLQQMSEINEHTMIIASLNKGFGASGGLILLGSKAQLPIIKRFGGPVTWSQRINTAGIGAIMASIKIHSNNEITALQEKLRENINYFDSLIPTEHAGDGLPIRLIPFDDENKNIGMAKKMFDFGFYTSPLFFPVVAKGKAGLRIMLRADLDKSDIKRFSDCMRHACGNYTNC